MECVAPGKIRKPLRKLDLMGQVVISKEEQERMRDKEQIKCLKKMLFGPRLNRDIYCNSTWDEISCWPDTEPNTTAYKQCASYINGFYSKNFASRKCMTDGQWYIHPYLNRTWTNYSLCFNDRVVVTDSPVTSLMQGHMNRIRLMYNIGYGLSCATLVIAVFVMIYFKRLHCPRNTVHLNLFIAFMLRAVVSLLKENLLVKGLGLPSDVEQTPYDSVIFIEEGSHWECKALFTVFYYVLSASYMWIFVEGLHLHTLIMVSVFSERSSVKWYILIGWGFPVMFLVPWIMVRVFLENVYCWNTNPTPGYIWIINGPVVCATVINFIFFVNILRALFTKTHVSKSAKKHRYRRLAKSTLVLIPLFGVHCIIFIGLQESYVSAHAEVIKLYFEMFFNSFQGLLVSILFCFMNGEVQMEIMKAVCKKRPYYRYKRYYRNSNRDHSYRCTCQKKNRASINENQLNSGLSRCSSADASSALLLMDYTKNSEPINEQWRRNMKGNNRRPVATQNYSSNNRLRRAQSCL